MYKSHGNIAHLHVVDDKHGCNEKSSAIALSDFLSEIKSEIDLKFSHRPQWITGEISSWHENKGSYYGELIEYEGNKEKVLAKIRMTLWSKTAKRVVEHFESESGEKLTQGIKVLLKVSVNFHKQYGMSLNIHAIDPNFTIGDRESRKKAIIKTLTARGIINNNKSIQTPHDFTKVAIISSKNAAGLKDFFAESNKLEKYGLCDFQIYEAAMQGELCPEQVSSQLREVYKKIRADPSHYDAVVLLRGGGSQSDLDWFNSLEIANAICNMNLPVFIGIGHDQDKTILDEVAHLLFGTPSKVINHIAESITKKALLAKEVIALIKSTTHAKISYATTVSSSMQEQIISNSKHASIHAHKMISSYNKETLLYSAQYLKAGRERIDTHMRKASENAYLHINHAKEMLAVIKIKHIRQILRQHKRLYENHYDRISVSISDATTRAGERIKDIEEKITGSSLSVIYQHKNSLGLRHKEIIKDSIYSININKKLPGAVFGKLIAKSQEIIKDAKRLSQGFFDSISSAFLSLKELAVKIKQHDDYRKKILFTALISLTIFIVIIYVLTHY